MSNKPRFQHFWSDWFSVFSFHSHSVSVATYGFTYTITFIKSLFSSAGSSPVCSRSKLDHLSTYQDWRRLPSDLHWRDLWWGTYGPSLNQPEEQNLRDWYPSLAALYQVCTTILNRQEGTRGQGTLTPQDIEKRRKCVLAVCDFLKWPPKKSNYILTWPQHLLSKTVFLPFQKS